MVRGETVISPDPGRSAIVAGDWPGREEGLTARGSEVLALITQGLSNVEIAERTYLSINSSKAYIRSAYRKIEAQKRAKPSCGVPRMGPCPIGSASSDRADRRGTDNVGRGAKQVGRPCHQQTVPG